MTMDGSSYDRTNLEGLPDPYTSMGAENADQLRGSGGEEDDDNVGSSEGDEEQDQEDD